MRNVMSLFLLLGVSRNTTTVLFIVIMVVVLFRTILHMTLPAYVQMVKLLILVGNLVEMRLAIIGNPVCLQRLLATRTNIVFPIMIKTQIVLPIVVMVLVYLPILLLSLPPALVMMVLSGLDIVPNSTHVV